MTPKQIFEQYGALPIKDVVSKELCVFISHAMYRSAFYKNGKQNDYQVQNAVSVVDHEPMLETVQEIIWHKLESVLEEELIPTYSYGRIYTNGNALEKHTDRPACEISITVQLGRTHHYAWPIFMGEQRYDLGEGDGVIYKGCDVPHWRNVCDGPDNYLSGQLFMHYVKANGKYATEHAGDKRWSLNEIPFNRTSKQIWENK